MGLGQLEILSFFQCGDRLYTSESDVYRRQILTYKDVPALKELTDTSVQAVLIPMNKNLEVSLGLL